MYQEFFVHCIVIINDGGMRKVAGGDVVDLYQGVQGGGGSYLIVVVFLTCVFVFCSLMPSVSLFLSD